MEQARLGAIAHHGVAPAQPLFALHLDVQDAIDAIGEHDRDHVEPLARHGPQRLHGIGGGAIAAERQHLAVRRRHARAHCQRQPEADRAAGQVMNYTSGTTGRPKGVRRSLMPFDPDTVGSMFAMFLYLTLYIQNILGYSALESGIRFMPVTLLSFIVAPISGAPM